MPSLSRKKSLGNKSLSVSKRWLMKDASPKNQKTGNLQSSAPNSITRFVSLLVHWSISPLFYWSVSPSLHLSVDLYHFAFLAFTRGFFCITAPLKMLGERFPSLPLPISTLGQCIRPYFENVTFFLVVSKPLSLKEKNDKGQ